MKFGTLFSGGELAGVGIMAAGWQHAWGVEHDPAIAAVAKLNGFDVTVADVLACDPRDFEPVDALHASPVCTRASNANNSAELNDEGTKEAPLDIAMGEKVAEFIDALAPRVVTIENVYAYRNFKAFGKITAALTRGGYFWDYDHLNAADFGVPQTRRRLILRAVKGALLPHLPAPVEWVGWYAAIEDLLDTLPASQFAPWQLARLPEGLAGSTLIDGKLSTSGDLKMLQANDANTPSGTVVASHTAFRDARAFLVYGDNSKQEWSEIYTPGDQPARTIRTQHAPRAWLVNGDNTSRDPSILDNDTPAFTIGAAGLKRPVRAFLVGTNGTSMTTLPDEEPSATVVGSKKTAMPKAYLVNTREMHGNEEGSNAYTAVDADTPAYTLAASSMPTRHRAWLSAGRVVAMTPRALARFQSVPDWYQLPDKAALACKIIGNGVPCLMMQRIYEGLRP